jgi:hypothetical protein
MVSKSMATEVAAVCSSDIRHPQNRKAGQFHRKRNTRHQAPQCHAQGSVCVL